MRNYTLNHSRVQTYRVTHNPGHHNFLISPRLLHEKNLRFIYSDESNRDVEKLIPVDYLRPHLKYKRIFHKDEKTLRYEFRGEAFEVDEKIIFEYESRI